jgi:hypothetical protein
MPRAERACAHAPRRAKWPQQALARASARIGVSQRGAPAVASAQRTTARAVSPWRNSRRRRRALAGAPRRRRGRACVPTYLRAHSPLEHEAKHLQLGARVPRAPRRANKTAGTITKLANPHDLTYVDDLLIHASGIYWGARANDATTPRSVSRHDGTNAELTTLRNYSDVVTDGSEIFYFRFANDERILEAVSTSGGAPRTVKTATDGPTRTYAVIGVDTAEVFYSSSELINGGTVGSGDLMAIRKDGSGERTVASGYRASWQTVLGATHLYWADQDAQTNLRRVAKTGGTSELFAATQPGDYFRTLATDACNVYYATTRAPAAVFAKSREP